MMKKPTLNFKTIAYLALGNERQQYAYKVLSELQILHLLDTYSPLLVGTLPIDVDLPESDLDIICEVHDFIEFERLIVMEFGKMKDFKYVCRTVDDLDRMVIHFTYQNWPIEIFGQPVPTIEQNGYLHLLIEYKLLCLLGPTGNERIRELKKQGLKTEPAFAHLLGLDGNPYERLIEINEWEEERLIGLLGGIKSIFNLN